MQKLISELTRLYLPAGASADDTLARRMAGHPAPAPALVTGDGRTRAIVLHFHPAPGAAAEQPWTDLCAVANALQTALGLPAPAVSISGTGYDLWLSLDEPVPLPLAATFRALLRAAYAPETDQPPGADMAPPVLPPCALPGGERWAAFIHPELGASFAGDPALELAPPPAGQAALLEGLHSISAAQFEHALRQLGHTPHGAPENTPASPRDSGCAPAQPHDRAAPPATPPGLLLQDATLDDIVRWLHARNIEPTFRHLLPK
ncbi:MAG TPA: hypothetical protein VJ752_04270 [Burkholderiaceae bacterium]|nr:hypothetical protein [Burkholderiaceae bacterium]